MENKILELEKKLQDMELKHNHLFEIVEELNYYFLKGVHDGGAGKHYYYPTSIPRDNLKYLESGLRVFYKDSLELFTSRLKEDDIRKDLLYSSLSELIEGIKEENIGNVASKHLWSIYDKVKKLKDREKNKTQS